MRLLLFLNEAEVMAHDDIYRACDFLRTTYIISDYNIYPFLARLSAGIAEKALNHEILELVETVQPDCVLWMHTGSLRIYDQTWKVMQKSIPQASWGYWDGDIYCQKYRPVPSEMIDIARRCDVIFLQGLGETSAYMAQRGCKDIRYVPAFFDEIRFPHITGKKSITYDVVFIGNNITSRNPFRITMEGTKLRKKVVTAFQKKYGSRFAVFGEGWRGPCAKGTINFAEQYDVYGKSKITFGINNVHCKYYFSNRLPIAMHCGIPIIHSYEMGFETLFAECQELMFFTDEEQAIQQSDFLLEKGEDELRQVGNALHLFAEQNFSVNLVFSYMINVLKFFSSIRSGDRHIPTIQNPWICE